MKTSVPESLFNKFDFIKKETLAQLLSSEFSDIFKKNLFTQKTSGGSFSIEQCTNCEKKIVFCSEN